MMRTFLGPVALALACLVPLRALADPPADPERRTPVVIAVETAAPAVVNISTTKLMEVDPWFAQFYGRQSRTRKVQSVGSGVIVHADGYVITNYHVVREATETMISLGNGEDERSYPAVILAQDPRNDLALLKIAGDRPFPAVTMGRSDDLMIGEPAIAVGNPFSVGKTVTTGVISALDRTLEMKDGVTFEDFIQTDAAINPGNSGGPLLNIHGEMIGVTTAIRRDGEGSGFAIPVDRVKEILEKLIEAAVVRANLGFRPVSGPGGVRVALVDDTGPAHDGGLKVDDVIERVEQRAVETVFDFATPILGKKPGDRILVTVRRAGERRRVDLVVPEPPVAPEVQYVSRRLGIVGRDPTPEEARKGVTGTIGTEIVTGGPADRVKMEPGDIVVALGRYSISSVAYLASLLEQRARAGDTVEIEVVRAGRAMTGTVTIR